ncbi:MAG TPA: hypothetical protein VGS15_06935 [Candidatus Acidoferrales bacterium]|nr:hypothetical protein [Candidatus Acidoferrales bacterium]
MHSVADHFKAIHERATRDSELAKEEHLGIAAHNKRIAELHRELHKSTGASDSPHARLAIEHDGLAQRHATLAKRIGEHGEYHRGMAAEVGKSAVTADLRKRRSDDEIEPSRVSAINRGANHLIPRTGTPVARTGTDDAPVAPQLAKIVAMDD